MSDTSMIRISSVLRDKLKSKAKLEGRTLEWIVDDAISKYLSIQYIGLDKYSGTANLSPEQIATMLSTPIDEPTQEPFEPSA